MKPNGTFLGNVAGTKTMPGNCYLALNRLNRLFTDAFVSWDVDLMPGDGNLYWNTFDILLSHMLFMLLKGGHIVAALHIRLSVRPLPCTANDSKTTVGI